MCCMRAKYRSLWASRLCGVPLFLLGGAISLLADLTMVLLQKLQCTALDGVHAVGLEVFCALASKV